MRCMERVLGMLSDVVITVSEQVKNDLIRYRVAPDHRIQVIPLGLELDEFLGAPREPGAFREEFGIPEDAPIVAIVGRIFPIKNHELFLRRRPGLPSKTAMSGS